MNSKLIRGYILAGLVVWLPVVVTFVIVRFLVDLLDTTISLLPNAYHPDKILGMHIPGLGVVLSLLVLIVTGVVITNILGQRLFRLGDAILARIPLVRSIYYAAKQIINAVFASNSQAFRKVMLVQYPREGVWSLAFLTGSSNPEIIERTSSEMYSVYIPTTPNPTSGFLVMVAKKDAIELSMSVEEAMKYIISLGVVQHTAPASDVSIIN